MTLRSKTTALLACLITLTLVLSGLVMLHYQQQALKESIFQGAEGMASTTAQAITTFLHDATHDAQLIASTLAPENLQQNQVAQMEDHLRNMLALNPKFSNGLFVLNHEGRLMADYPAHPELHGKYFAHRDYFQRTLAQGRGAVGTPYHSARTGKPVLTFTGVIRDRGGKLIGIVGCSTDLLSPVALGNLRMLRLGETGYLYLIDSTRLMIMHPMDERILKRDVPPGANALLDAALAGFNGVGETVDGPHGTGAGFKGFEGVGDTINSRGIPMLLALKHIPNTDWILGVQQPQAEAYRPLTAARARIALITAASLAIAALLGSVFVKRITRPLTDLHLATIHIGQELQKKSGHLGREYSQGLLRRVRSNDEIGSLARSFSTLVGELDLALTASHKAAQDWARTFDAVHDAIFILTPDQQVQQRNRVASDWFPGAGGPGNHPDCKDLVFGSAAPPDGWHDLATLQEGQHMHAVFDNATRPGVFELHASPITENGRTLGAVLVLRDITNARRAEQRIHELAFFDALTGLPNRPLLMDRMQQALALAQRHQQPMAVLFLDLDRFKQVNDTLGHASGDELLKQVAGRLLGCLRKNDSVARLGGDEFVLLALDITNTQGAAAIAKKIIEVLPLPYRIAGQEVHVTTSIGIALYPDDGSDSPTLLRNADHAMYVAKQRGRNAFQFFSVASGSNGADRRS
ncbi:MAG: diguanylate cyclase domain-containing protein [Rhodoferax sp.]